MNSSGTVALATVLCTLIGVAPWHVIAADGYPSRPVTVVVPFTPGGSTDIMARYEAEVLQRALGQSFVPMPPKPRPTATRCCTHLRSSSCCLT